MPEPTAAADDGTDPIIGVYDVACPKCSAGPGDGCWSLRRGTTEACAWPHRERRAAFRRLRDG